jgi:predicted transcriptional regulator
VENKGTYRSEQTYLNVYVNKRLYDRLLVPIITPGESHTFELVWNASNLARITAELELSGGELSVLTQYAPETIQKPAPKPWYIEPPLTLWAILGAVLVGVFVAGRFLGTAPRLQIKLASWEAAQRGLSARIYQYICACPGKSQDEIAKAFGLPYGTVRKHIQKLLRRPPMIRLITKPGEKKKWIYPVEEKVPKLLPPQRALLIKLALHPEGLTLSTLALLLGMGRARLQGYLAGEESLVGLGYVHVEQRERGTLYSLEPSLQSALEYLARKTAPVAVGEIAKGTRLPERELTHALDLLTSAGLARKVYEKYELAGKFL